MASISNNYTDNYGGLKVIKYAIAQDLEDLIDWMTLWQDPDTIDVPQSVIDNHFHDISPILLTPQLQAPSEISAGNKQTNNSLEARFNKDRADIRSQLEKVTDRGLVLYIEDRNGAKKLIGTPESPMRQNEDYRTGMKMMDFNGYTFYFTGSTPHKPPLVNLT
ncbi:hypothetical protein [Marinoscillum furvescens]|uniref:Uncharacterized protein n=1 Tax=Marinoscillum furvescens DSM 4134 TaxID=1122208 RepID=A0A3D9L764_MARFU|nr:hypothetical protein [Marinoscillum furvescens]REE01140.1 hypothetical protein C7460_104160 [Marinoscillum furvescens DSM 4134]